MATSVTLKPNAIDISGTTSGTVTLQAPSVAGTTTITLPSTSGTLLTSASTATTSTNLAGGSNGTIPYQSASGTTQMLAVGTSGQVLQTNGVGAPSWVAAATGNVTLTGTETLTNKTLTAPTIASANLTTALTLAGAAGTNGQVLTSAGSGLPSWTTVGSGALTLLSTVTASASATVDIETTFSSTYDVYLIEVSGLSVASDGVPLICQMKIGGSYITTSTYLYHSAANGSNSATYSAYNSGTSSNIYLADNIGNAANRMANFYMHVSNPSSTTKSKMVTWQGGCINASGVLFSIMGSGINTGTSALTGIRFSTNGNGNITAGNFRLYGIANS